MSDTCRCGCGRPMSADDEPRVDITLTRYTDPLAAVRAVRDAASSVCVEILRRAQEQGQ